MDNESKNSASTPEEQVQNVEKSKKSKKRSKNKKSSSQENPKTSEVQSQNNEINPDQTESNEAGFPMSTNPNDMLKTLKALNLNEVMKIGKDAGSTKVYKFWNTQPVPQLQDQEEKINESEMHQAIEPDKQIAEIKQDPYSLPEGFVWDTLDLNNEVTLKELYTLLNENYVEDDDAMFRFDYQPDFLRWALQPPHWRREW
jgi:glycylpeptide N-tetradecanoyltransferase